jgi:hypothetical protein
VKRAEDMRHTCDTARSGSERSENTRTACHEELARAPYESGWARVAADFERKHGPRTDTTTK